jgi:hypothetical protein
MTKFIRQILITLFCCAIADAEEPVDYSGPQPGERLPKFDVVDAFEMAEEKPYDVIARIGEKPSILVVIHDMLSHKSDEPSLGLAYVLMHYAGTRKDTGLERNVVFLTDDLAAMKEFLTKIRRALPKKETPITISTDGLEGPGSWGFNRNLRMTIVISEQGRTTASFALQQPSVNADTPKVLKELVRVIGGDVPRLQDLDFPYYVGKPPATNE